MPGRAGVSVRAGVNPAVRRINGVCINRTRGVRFGIDVFKDMES
jgi:hypothetical protein